MKEFVDYVMGFYGNGGVYDMDVTTEHVMMATGLRMGMCEWRGISFEGDNIDREAVRDILIERFGYKWPEAA